jgi:hypothetical protein
MLSKLRALLAGLGAASVVLAVLAGPAPAATVGPDLTVEVRSTPKVLWTESSLPQMEARKVEIRVLAPTGPGGKREIWQWCRVDYVGLGTYSCGVDVGPRSPARELEGKWAARLLIDGELQARKYFSLN